MKNQNRHLLIVTDYLSCGGSTTFIRGLIQQLLKHQKIIIHLASFRQLQPSPLQPLPPHPRLHCYDLYLKDIHRLYRLPHRVIALHQVLFQLKNINIDLVYTDLTLPSLAFQIDRLFHPNLRHTPLYSHIHGSFSQEIKSQEHSGNSRFLSRLKYFLLYYLEHLSITRSQKIFVNSRYSLNLTKKLHGNLPLEINQPGIDHSFSARIRKISKSAARTQLGLNPSHQYILLTSRIEPRKGVTDFFENISSSQFPHAKLIVCSHFSEGPFLYPFLKTMNQSQLGSDVFLINAPSRHQLSLLYRAADVTVLPSVDLETFGFTTLESFYFKTPVVAFNIGANSELIPSSYLVKYSTKNKWRHFYQKISQVLNHPDLIQYDQYQYSWKKYVDKLLSK